VLYPLLIGGIGGSDIKITFQTMRKTTFLQRTLLFWCLCSGIELRAQPCNQQVTQLSGTQQISCTTVTVTSSGSVGNLSFCGQNPYWIGLGDTNGSYTFTFSPPVSGVRLGLTAINNLSPINPGAIEEVRFEINGSFYPITVPGTVGSCGFPLAVITGGGNVGAQLGEAGEWNNMNINTSISTLKVEDIVLGGIPNGVVFSLYICPACCTTNAGTLAPPGPFNVCINTPFSFPAANGVVLDGNDLLRYVLYTNPADPEGSIIATSVSPTFSFNPATMQTGVTYYVAAMAGNGIGSNIDLNDPCLDFSNVLEITWRPIPAVALSSSAGPLCAGACTTIEADFTGFPPFTLTYNVPGVGASTQSFPGNTGTFQVCLPANAPPGNLLIQTTALTDAVCTCN
jgi:hypothetical protein